MSVEVKVAILGAEGPVGEAMRELLEQSGVEVKELFLLVADEEAENSVLFRNKTVTYAALAGFDFAQVDIALVGDLDPTAVELVVAAAKAGAVVITHQPAFRFAKEIPLVVAAVNPEAIADYATHNIVALPDASSVHVLRAVQAIRELAGIVSLELVNCIAVSEAGRPGIDELAGQTANLLNARPIEGKLFPQQIAFNVVPQVGETLDDGRTRDERIQARSIHKVWEDEAVAVETTWLQVPVFFGHVSQVAVTTRADIDRASVLAAWGTDPAIELATTEVASPVTSAVNADRLHLCRLRQDPERPQRLLFLAVADNVRFGLAGNAIQVVERLVRDYL